jgi:hypothetical protein
MHARIAVARRTLAAAVSGLTLILWTGCASYQLGSPTEPAFKSVFVPVAANDAFLPQSRAAVTTAVREAFARDGRLVLAESPEAADRIVEIRLKDYSREMATALPTDTALARKFALTLLADVSLVDPRARDTAQPPFEVSVSVDAFTDSGQQQAEYQAVPLLAGKLATEIVHRVLDTW